MRKPHTLRAVVAVVVILIAGLILGSCSCVLKKVIDQATVTVRGLAAANEVSQKANEGYDVREARAKWLQALDAYNNQDFARANQLIDETYSELDDLEKVAERVYYQSSDGLTVSGLIFRPLEGEGPWPTIIVNHAGFGTAGDFSDVALTMRDWGYLVFNPDFRGSGESQGSHEGAKGEVDDVISAIDYLKSQGLVEDNRIGLYGQSHGAAISLLAAGRCPDIKAVVAEAAFTDAVDLYDNVNASDDSSIQMVRDELIPMIGGTPEEVPEEYEVRSAINYVDSIQAAVLLIHGEQDPLIPVDQAYRMYDALQASGKTVEIKIYPDEAHCVNAPEGRIEVWELTRAWFEMFV
ncbi:MAG: alpha/beta fold hydrolase [Actinomycetota bacterium]|nr:alpha/beta fold hydrolase [Actinomycetota bacterium]